MYDKYTPMDRKDPWECFVMNKSLGRRRAENEIFENLQRKFCSEALLKNPRMVDIVDQIEKVVINMYLPQASYISDMEYVNLILPKMRMLVNNDSHFKVTEEGNILISLPLLQEDDHGNQERRKEIQYNKIDEGMEKISILDYYRYGIDRLFKSVRCVYDQNGIEIERQVEKLERDDEGSKTTYSFKERLKDKPHILKITNNTKQTKERGKVRYYDVRHSRHIEDLDETQADKIEENDIKELTQKEKQQIIVQMDPIYQQGMRTLMGIDIEQDYR